MVRLLIGLVILGAILTGSFLALNTRCPMMVDGPGSVVSRTQSHLNGLHSAVTAYRLKESKYPNLLDDLVDTSFLDRLPIDPYGSSYNFRLLASEAEFEIYSSGPNKIAEFGGGDDIVLSGKSYDCPTYYRCATICEQANYSAFAGGVVTWLAAGLVFLALGSRTAIGFFRQSQVLKRSADR